MDAKFIKRPNWYIVLGCLLILFSVLSYIVQITIFHRTDDTFFYMLQDIAFLPMQVLLVTLIINELLRRREKRAILNKMNMVIGAFFSEVGTNLLSSFFALDRLPEKIRGDLIITNDWPSRKFTIVRKSLENYDCKIEIPKGGLEDIKNFLTEKRDFLLRLLENPNLLEHESFTDLLWAVFHLTEELVHRKNAKMLTDTDSQHLVGDIKRAYVLLMSEWLAYMEHLRREYPYLFSLATRTNPFDPNASADVK
jgi:hypothetical protein